MPQDPTDQWYSERDISTTLVKGMKVLAAFNEDQAWLSLPEIGRITSYDRATVRRLVITLVDLGFITKSDKSFSLSPKVLTLSSFYLRSHGVGATVQPILNRYSERIGKEISLATLSDGYALYLARSNVTNSAIFFGFTVGSRLPLLHTAIGRMLLATAQSNEMDTLIDNSALVQYTADSSMDRQVIRGRVQDASDQGFTLVCGEFEAGITGLAVPVGHHGKAKTVIGISAPTGDLQNEKIQSDCLSILHLCGNELDRAWMDGP
jgi:IclR family pca regulon transcriptional regulator